MSSSWAKNFPVVVLTVSVIAAAALVAACGSDRPANPRDREATPSETSTQRPDVPTPDMTRAVLTMEAVANSPEQIQEVRSMNATVRAEAYAKGTTRMELGPSTAGSTVEIAGQQVRLPNDVYIVDYIYAASGGPVTPPIWVFGKGESMIDVSRRTGAVGEPRLVNAALGHFDELRAILSGLDIQPTPLPQGTPTPTPTLTATPTAAPITGGPVIPEFATSSPESLGAGLSGTLVVEGSCLYIDGQSGTTWLPVFPQGTVSWDGDGLLIHGAMMNPPDVGRVDIGEMISIGGGEIIPEKFQSLPFTQEPAPSCDTANVWMVAQVASR